MLWFKSRKAPSSANTPSTVDAAPQVTSISPQEIVDAESTYAREILRTIGVALLVSLLIFTMQAALAFMPTLTEATTGPHFSPPGLDASAGGAALAVLLPLSIALQVLLRLPRDPEAIGLGEAIAQRQFWGGISAVVAMGSAFIALSTFASAMSANVGSEIVDVVALFGVPFGAVATLLLSADGAVLSNMEANRHSLRDARNGVEVESRRTAIARVRGKARAKPLRDAIVQGCVVGIASVAFTAYVTSLWFGVTGAVISTVFTSALTLLVIGGFNQVLSSALQKHLLEVVGVLLMLTVLTLSSSMSAIVVAMPLVGDSEDPWAYVYPMLFGILLVVPPFIVLAALAAPRRERARTAPLLALAVKRMTAEIERLQRPTQMNKQTEPWRTFAGTAIVLAPLPLVALPLAALATWHRRDAPSSRRRSLIWAWALPSAVAVIEIAAVVFFPVYSTGLGWLTLT